MRRREFIAGLGAAWWPLAARAQQRTVPVVGFLDLSPPRPNARYAEFRRGLAEAGFVDGHYVARQTMPSELVFPSIHADRQLIGSA